MTLEELKEHLSSTVSDASRWRSERARQYPHDERHQKSADALGRLGQRLAGLPADHPDLRRLWSGWYRPREDEGEADAARLIETESACIGRYGFDGPGDGDPAGFLRGLAAALDDAAQC